MAHRKAGGTAKNLRDSNPKYLGIKIADGQVAKTGQSIVRQRGTRFLPGKNVGLANDHALFAEKDGVVKFTQKRKMNIDGTYSVKKVVNVEVE